MNAFQSDIATYPDADPLQIPVPPDLLSKLSQVAALRQCSVEDFVRSAASDEADRALVPVIATAAAGVLITTKPGPRRPLTPRELQVLHQLSKGCTIAEAGKALDIRWFTVNDHIKSIYRKLGVGNRAAALMLASRMGLLP